MRIFALLTLLCSGYAPKDFRWETWGQSGLYKYQEHTEIPTSTYLVAPIGSVKRKRSNAGLGGPRGSPKKKQNQRLDDSPPMHVEPILDPSLAPEQRERIIKATRERIIEAQKLYLSLSHIIHANPADTSASSLPKSLKADIEQSRIMRKTLQTELGDSIFKGADLSVKRPSSETSDQSDNNNNLPKKRGRKPKIRN